MPRNLKELNSNLPAPNYEDPNKRRIQSAIVPRSTVNAENGNSKVPNLPDPKNIGPDDGNVGKSRNFSQNEKPAYPKDETPPLQDSPYRYKRDSLNKSNNLRSLPDRSDLFEVPNLLPALKPTSDHITTRHQGYHPSSSSLNRLRHARRITLHYHDRHRPTPDSQ